MKILEKIKNVFEKIIDFFEYGFKGVPATNLKIKYYNKKMFNKFYYYIIKINNDYRIVKFYNKHTRRVFIYISNRKRDFSSSYDVSSDKLKKEEWKALIKLLKKEKLYKEFDEYIIKKNNEKVWKD